MKAGMFSQELLMRFMAFLGVGGACYLIALFLLWLSVSVFGVNYIYGMIMAFFLVNPAGYFMNRFYVFNKGGLARQGSFSRFMIVAIAGLLVAVFIVWLLVECFGVNYFLSNIFSTIVVLLLNFIMNGFWTFRVK